MKKKFLLPVIALLCLLTLCSCDLKQFWPFGESISLVIETPEQKAEKAIEEVNGEPTMLSYESDLYFRITYGADTTESETKANFSCSRKDGEYTSYCSEHISVEGGEEIKESVVFMDETVYVSDGKGLRIKSTVSPQQFTESVEDDYELPCSKEDFEKSEFKETEDGFELEYSQLTVDALVETNRFIEDYLYGTVDKISSCTMTGKFDKEVQLESIKLDIKFESDENGLSGELSETMHDIKKQIKISIPGGNYVEVGAAHYFNNAMNGLSYLPYCKSYTASAKISYDIKKCRNPASFAVDITSSVIDGKAEHREKVTGGVNKGLEITYKDGWLKRAYPDGTDEAEMSEEEAGSYVRLFLFTLDRLEVEEVSAVDMTEKEDGSILITIVPEGSTPGGDILDAAADDFDCKHNKFESIKKSLIEITMKDGYVTAVHCRFDAEDGSFYEYSLEFSKKEDSGSAI